MFLPLFINNWLLEFYDPIIPLIPIILV